MPTNQDVKQEFDVDFFSYLALFWKKKYVILLFLILGAGLGFAYTKTLQDRYEVSCSFFLSGDRSPSLIDNASLFLGSGSSFGNQISAYIEVLLKSRIFIQSVSQDLRPYFPGKTDEQIRGELEFSKGISFDKQKEGHIILSFSHRNPKVAFEVMQACLKNFEVFNNLYEFSVSKKILTMIDPPVYSNSVIGKGKTKIMGFSLGISFLSSILLILLLNAYAEYKKRQ